MECDTLLVCIGRKPYTDGLGLEVCLDVLLSMLLVNISIATGYYFRQKGVYSSQWTLPDICQQVNLFMY